MPSLTPGQIVDALARNDASRLIGTDEGEQVDFKRAPYLLTENHQKWELAKDVAAFANKRGGVVVIGVATESQRNEIIETAVALHPVRKALVVLQQYRGVIDSWIYPRPEDIDLRWYPSEPDEEAGLLLIEVPSQRETNIPFIVRDMRDPETEFKGSVGIPRRDRERVVWDTAADIHRQMTRAGSNPGPVASSGNTALARAEARVLELERMQGWEERPQYYLQALPPEGREMQGFYDDVRRTLTSHQILREAGFSPWENSRVDGLDGGWLAHRSDIVTWIEPEGLVTHGLLVADNTYLGWYFNQSRAEGAPLILHPIAVVEITLEFFRFLHSEIKPRMDRGPWRYRIFCRGFRSHSICLPTGNPTSQFVFPQPPIASYDDWDRVFDEAGSPTRDAFEALQRFYFLFGHPATAIPLVVNNEISEEALMRLG
jgi:hypothetical protein